MCPPCVLARLLVLCHAFSPRSFSAATHPALLLPEGRRHDPSGFLSPSYPRDLRNIRATFALLSAHLFSFFPIVLSFHIFGESSVSAQGCFLGFPFSFAVPMRPRLLVLFSRTFSLSLCSRKPHPSAFRRFRRHPHSFRWLRLFTSACHVTFDRDALVPNTTDGTCRAPHPCACRRCHLRTDTVTRMVSHAAKTRCVAASLTRLGGDAMAARTPLRERVRGRLLCALHPPPSLGGSARF